MKKLNAFFIESVLFGGGAEEWKLRGLECNISSFLI